MAIKIRLARWGSKKRPFYRIVIAEVEAPRDGRFIEKVGTYNPMLPKEDAKRITLEVERLKHWISVGAQPTDRVARFLGEAGLIAMPKPHNNPIKAQPKKKAQERMKAEAERKTQEEADKKAATEAASQAAMAPETVAEESLVSKLESETAASDSTPEAAAEEAPSETAAG